MMMSMQKGCSRRGISIAVRNVSKTFRETRVSAVRNVSLTLDAGTTLGLVGESGSGKTTLAKIIVGLLKADSGEIIGGKDMQIVFQDPFGSLDPRMRMRDIVLEGLSIRGTSRREMEATLKDVLFKVHLNYNDRLKYPHQFSGGERQRIAIARALAVKPKILILDEPVSSLDVLIQREILDLLRELQREFGLTYLFISHDLRAVAYMAGDIAVMRAGEIVETGPREAVLGNPQHAYTKRLLASAV